MAPRLLFEQELEQLVGKVADMGSYAEIGYQKLQQALTANDREAMYQLLDSDRKMMDMLRETESECLVLMTKQQPLLARDLRLVTAAMKIVTELERIGDHVSEITELFLRREGEFGKEKCDELLFKMLKEDCIMLREAMEAFVEGDADTAKTVVDNDDVVDDLFNDVKNSMMEAIREKSLDADRVVDDLMISKYLEKVGDHAVNIAEWAAFRVTGKIEGQDIY